MVIELSNNGKYSLSPKVVKDLQDFLKECLSQNGEFLEAAVDTISHLFRSYEGCKIVVGSSEIFNKYVALSRSTQDIIKKPYYESLVSLTASAGDSSKEAQASPKYNLAINVVNCIGSPPLALGLTHNIHANNHMVEGI